MNTKQWTPVLIASLLAFGSVQASADGGRYYDEDIDASNFSYAGSIVSQSTSHLKGEAVKHADSGYYDEDIDPIAFNSEGSRSNHTRTNSSIEAPVLGFDLAYLDQ